eukprot:364265-Chlamydomonas_euryale.AAC.4
MVWFFTKAFTHTHEMPDPGPGINRPEKHKLTLLSPQIMVNVVPTSHSYAADVMAVLLTRAALHMSTLAGCFILRILPSFIQTR